MKTSDFFFDLPKELIAQHPTDKRDESRLFIVHKNNNTFEHKSFKNIIDYLHPGDVLIVNDTRVIPARLFGIKEETNAKIECLLLKHEGDDVWQCIIGNAKVVKINTTITFGDNLHATCVKIGEQGIRYMKMIYEGIFIEVLEQLGETPLPPYIKEKGNDANRYQTVYAKENGSAAAPTAGLHFTSELLQQIQEKGIIIAPITLHVGLGTFKPMETENIHDHHMHSEYYHCTQETADIINKAKKENRRIITVGTTSTRVIETIANKMDVFEECEGFTDIFIYPGYTFKATTAIITNFHLPESTLILMICAFASKELIMKAYETAIEEKYRFFSFGDSMFITNE